MEKCIEFKREQLPVKTVVGIIQREIQFCKVIGSDAQCFGFKEYCKFPDKFKPKQ